MSPIIGSPVKSLLLFSLPALAAVAIVACGGTADSEVGGEGAETTIDEAVEVAPSSDDEDSSDETAAGQDADGEDAVGVVDEEDQPEQPQPEIEPVVFADDFGTSVQPIFAENCASCHSPGGPGSPHWELATVADIQGAHDYIASLIGSGAMPPWPAGGESPPFLEDRSLRADQVQAILVWSSAGAPLDVPAETEIEPVGGTVTLTDPDRVIAPAQPYAGSTSVIDDYRCQIYDLDLSDGSFITSYAFIPDQTEVVHHAIGYLLPASAREAAEARDGEDGKPGWECYGSSGLGEDDIFLGWAPGQLPSVMPAGTGLPIDPGSFIVVQIHYHYEVDAPADLSQLAVNLSDDPDLDPIVVTEYVAPAEIPCADDEEGPLCDRDAALADAIERFGREGVLADRILRLCQATVEDFAEMTDGIASSSCDIPAGLVGGTGEIVSVLGHEHEIGAWFRMTLNPGTPEEKVLLDIPDWDFDWQYNYRPAERIVIDGDDIVRIECGWDRSRRDPGLPPAYVLWADGTNDEMCFATITTRPA